MLDVKLGLSIFNMNVDYMYVQLIGFRHAHCMTVTCMELYTKMLHTGAKIIDTLRYWSSKRLFKLSDQTRFWDNIHVVYMQHTRKHSCDMHVVCHMNVTCYNTCNMLVFLFEHACVTT